MNEVPMFFKYLPQLSKIIFMLSIIRNTVIFFAKSYASNKVMFKQHYAVMKIKN